MRLLLDTHVFIWYVTDSSQLTNTAESMIDDGENQVFVSIVTLWEIAIKQSIGKLSFASPFREFIEQQLAVNDFQLLNIELEHLRIVSTLPLYHRDPFDRLLIAQAIADNLVLLSRDSSFSQYSVNLAW